MHQYSDNNFGNLVQYTGIHRWTFTEIGWTLSIVLLANEFLLEVMTTMG